MQERRGDSAVGERAPDAVRDGGARLGGGAVREAGQVHEPRDRLGDGVVALEARVGAALAVAGDGAVDEPGVAFFERLVVDLEPFRHAHREVLDEHVGLIHQAVEQLQPARLLEIERQGFLVPGPLEVSDPQVVLGLLVEGHALGTGVGRPHGHHVARGRVVHLDDFRPQAREQERRPGPRVELGQVQHPVSFERFRHKRLQRKKGNYILKLTSFSCRSIHNPLSKITPSCLGFFTLP